MSNFVVSARKYRPIRFDDVVGQQHVSQTLKNAIQNDHLAQAFLFCGPRGVGKTTCARILAKVLNCQSPTSDMEPCDTCDSCQSFNKNASLNISELDAASNNSVEHIRALIEQVRFAPQQGDYKIYIIDEVHMLSQQAFNAFLKTLEEPPSYAIFILATTEKHKIIPTILSRCQIFDFNRIQISDMTAHLQKICAQESIAAEEEALRMIAQKADGALRDALSIFDRIVSFSGATITYKDVIENLNILDYDYYFQVVDAIMSEDASQLLLLFDEVMHKGFDGDIFIHGLGEHLRNLLVCQDPRTVGLLEVGERTQERYQQQAILIAPALLLTALSLVNDCDVHYKTARNKRLHVEMHLLKMAYSQRILTAPVATSSSPTVPQQKKTKDASAPVYVVEDAAISYQKTTLTNTEEPKKSFLEQESKDVVTAPPTEDKAVATPPIQEALLKEETSDANAQSDSAPQKVAPPTKVSFSQKLAQKKGGSFLASIKNEVKQESQQVNKEALPFTPENLQQLWTTYYTGIESPSTQILYKTAEVRVLDAEQGSIQVIAQGNRAKDAIFRDRTLRELLVQEFQKMNLSLKVEISEQPIEVAQPKNFLPQNDRDKYVHFLKLNPTLKALQKRFQLLPPKNK